jgi:hypothetical protein
MRHPNVEDLKRLHWKTPKVVLILKSDF